LVKNQDCIHKSPISALTWLDLE